MQGQPQNFDTVSRQQNQMQQDGRNFMPTVMNPGILQQVQAQMQQGRQQNQVPSYQSTNFVVTQSPGLIAGMTLSGAQIPLQTMTQQQANLLAQQQAHIRMHQLSAGIKPEPSSQISNPQACQVPSSDYQYAAPSLPVQKFDLPVEPQPSQSAQPPILKLSTKDIPPSVEQPDKKTPAEQVKECMDVIQQALQDPNLASAGQVLLQAVQASSCVMSSLIEQSRLIQQRNQELSTTPAKAPEEVPSANPKLRPTKFLGQEVSSGNPRISPFPMKSPSLVGSCSEPTPFPPVQSMPLPSSSFGLAPFVQPKFTGAEGEISASFCPSSDICGTKMTSEMPAPPASSDLSSISGHGESLESSQFAVSSKSCPEDRELSLAPSSQMPRHPQDPKESQKTKTIPHKASCGKVDLKRSQKPQMESYQGSPHKYLLTILENRGQSVATMSSEEGGYFVDPSPLQLASFGTHLVKAVHGGDVELLRSLLGCGLSPNPCNSFGDSVLSVVCKRGDSNVLDCLLENSCDIQVCDSWGRTPLHQTACSGTFSKAIAQAILDRDINQLLVTDKQGKCPMEYVRKSQWGQWCSFLKEIADRYWPIGGGRRLVAVPREKRSGQLSDPPAAISLDLARAVSAGDIAPEEVDAMDPTARKSYKVSSSPAALTVLGNTRQF